VDGCYNWVQAPHVKAIALVEHVLHVQNLLGVIVRSQQRIMISTAETEFFTRNVVRPDLIVWLPCVLISNTVSADCQSSTIQSAHLNP
jgi:hypothetical protein